MRTALPAEAQGYMFRHGGACWLVTVAHALDDWGGFLVTMPGQPPVTGSGEAARPFWEGLDLAVGVVRDEAGQACTAELSDIDQQWSRATPTGALRLPFVSANGAVDRSAMRIVDVPDHKQFLAEFTDGAQARDGRSGSFLSSSGRLIGMAITKPTEDSAGNAVDNAHGFIRIEEIAMNLRRYVTARGVSLIEAAKPVVQRQEAGYPVQVESSTLEPASLRSSAENVLTDAAPFLFTGTGRIVLKVADGTAQELRGVRIVSSGPEVRPKDITIDIDTRGDGAFVPTWFWSGTMDNSGSFDTGERAARSMRRVAITISSAWGGDPRRIDRIVLY